MTEGLAVVAAALAALLLLALHAIARLRREHAALRGQNAERELALREQVALEERERIFADLHDDLGAGLLEMVYAAPDNDSADRARTMLQNLRDVVSRSRGDPGTLPDVLAGIRAETARRLHALGASLDWQAPSDLPQQAMDAGAALHLYRIVREAVSNAIRHAQTRHLRIRLHRGAGERLLIEITDYGSGGSAPGDSDGRGISNMRERAQALAGDIRWARGTEGGTKVVLDVPLMGIPG